MKLDLGRQCPNCGLADEVVGISREDVQNPLKIIGLRAVVETIQELFEKLGDTDEDLDESTSAILEEKLGWICLTCGEIWHATSEGNYASLWSANA